MELSDWRRDVPYGEYLQPIHLTIATGDSVEAPVAEADAESSTVRKPNGVAADANGGGLTAPSQPDPVAGGDSAPASPASPAAAVPVSKTVASDQISATPPATPKHLKRRQKPSPSKSSPSLSSSVQKEQANVKVIAPFTGEYIQGCDRIAMNVGGPVWAMDWLPQDASRRRKRKKSRNGDAADERENGGENRDSDVEDEDEQEAEAGNESGARRRAASAWRFLALSTHPPCDVVDGELVKNTPPDHYYDVGDGARSLVQIWAVPVQPKEKQKSLDSLQQTPSTLKPKLVFGIDHCSGVAWDLQWCPLPNAMSKHTRTENLLGVLAVCFGDGSLQIFEVPEIALELLSQEGVAKQGGVETLVPLIHAKVPKIIQLSIQWSPHRWNLLLTGGSDGSISLWNLEWELSCRGDPAHDSSDNALQLEPQRRFQDADAVGKQEAFEWGWGWVAVRSVAWSPFDEYIFATTGNDSIFKVWDIREPRICFRSHRIRSTWGLALQWMDHTTIQVSGDQGSIYMYDILSGSYQKLHFHPQIDSPVWDLQFARRGDVPLLVSCCTSGSIRVAPAKKLFRAPQNSIEICRIAGERGASIDRPFKALTANFEHKIVSGNAESKSGSAPREFCERDAALHRVRLSTHTPGSFPCFLAAAGHAGLVIVLEIQEEIDHLLENYFVQINKKLGRPRKGTVGNRSPWISAKKKQQHLVAGDGKKIGAGKKRGVVKSKKMHNALNKYKKDKKRKAEETAFPQFEMKFDSEEEEEYADEEEDESDSGLSLMMAEGDSEDGHLSMLDDEMEDFSHEDARMRSEYQLDLSEEDAMMLAIQMSELEQTQPTPPPAKSKEKAPAKATTKQNGKGSASTSSSATKAGTQSQPHSSQKTKKKASPEVVKGGAGVQLSQTTVVRNKTLQSGVTSSSKSKKARPKSASSAPATAGAFDGFIMDQATTLQIIQYQKGMSEEDALREAIRASEMEAKRSTTSRSKRVASPPPPKVPRAPTASVESPAVAPRIDTMQDAGERGHDAAHREKKDEQATRRLVFTPVAKGKDGSETGTLTAEVNPTAADRDMTVESNGTAEAVAFASPARGSSSATQTPPPSAPSTSTSKSTTKATTTPPASSGKKKAASKPVDAPGGTNVVEVSSTLPPAIAAIPGDSLTTPDEQRKPNRPSSSKASIPASKRKRPAKAPQPRKRPISAGSSDSRVQAGDAAAADVNADNGGYLTDEEALYLALRASEVEY